MIVSFARTAIAVLGLVSVAAPAAPAHSVPHLDLQEGTIAARYRNVHNSADVRTANQIEDRIAFRARVNADAKGRLALNVGAFTGSSITGGWDNTGVGEGTGTTDVFVKQLYASVSPTRAVEGQVGSLYVERGDSSEITSYDNDLYLTGERVVVRAPRYLLIDMLSVTNAYLGDVATPNSFRRLQRLADANYRQVLAQKRLSAQVSVSGDWSRAPEGDTWRGGVRLAPFGDRTTFRLEGYRRMRDGAGGGALTADARVLPRLSVTAGLASIDPRFPPINGDRYRSGRRIFAGANVRLVSALTASLFYTQAFATHFPVVTRRRWEVIATYNVLAAIRHARR